MIFSSPLFIALYLPVVLAIYYISPRKIKNLLLFMASLLFYGWGEPVYVSLMIFSTVVDYTHGKMVDKYRGTQKAKYWLLSSVIINLGLLGIFKYSGFLAGTINSLFGLNLPVPQLALPIGISFYTFQTMSYTIDVYRGDAPMQKDIIAFGTYVALFPQLIAGPIVRYLDVAEQMKGRTHSVDKFGEGASRFVCGLSKKVLLANTFGQVWELMSGGSLSLLGSWLGILCYALQIYFDFSGYSDMAIGLGRMFGFEFLINFDYPYISRSITEFWRRWHISLSTWFKEYVYIPLGGNRRGMKRQIFNILTVWLLTGLWHGASWNFVLWGGYYAVLLIIEKLGLLKVLKRAPTAVTHIYTMFLVMLGWALFFFEDLGALGSFLAQLFTPSSSAEAMPLILGYLPLLLTGSLAATPLWKKWKILKKDSTPAFWVETAALALMLLLCIASLASQSYNPFIYFRF